MERVSDEKLEKLIMSMFDWSVRNANIHSALTELRERRSEMREMIDMAGEAIGTDPTLRSSACVKVLADHVETLRKELRERRAAEKAPCPEHAKMVAKWDTYEMGRDDSSAAPYWCQLYAGSVLQGQGIGMTEGDAIRQALENVELKK